MQRAGPVGRGQVGPGIGDRLGGPAHSAGAGKEPGDTGEEDATQQHERQPSPHPSHQRGKAQPGAQANQGERRSRWTGSCHRGQQTQHGHQRAGHRADRGPRGRTQPLQPGQHSQANH
jgi:hypothetical protein